MPRACQRRLGRLLPALALAYLLPVMIGLYAVQYFRWGLWHSASRSGECRFLTAGRFMQGVCLPPLVRPAVRLGREITARDWG